MKNHHVNKSRRSRCVQETISKHQMSNQVTEIPEARTGRAETRRDHYVQNINKPMGGVQKCIGAGNLLSLQVLVKLSVYMGKFVMVLVAGKLGVALTAKPRRCVLKSLLFD